MFVITDGVSVLTYKAGDCLRYSNLELAEHHAGRATQLTGKTWYAAPTRTGLSAHMAGVKAPWLP